MVKSRPIIVDLKTVVTIRIVFTPNYSRQWSENGCCESTMSASVWSDRFAIKKRKVCSTLNKYFCFVVLSMTTFNFDFTLAICLIQFTSITAQLQEHYFESRNFDLCRAQWFMYLTD